MKTITGLLALLFTAVVVCPARAAVLVTTPAPQTSTTTFPNDNAPLTRVQVGNADVPITGFGTYGQFTTASSAKFVIFLANFSYSSVSATRQLVSGPVAEPVAAAAWVDSPSLSYTLLANQTYYMGMITNTNAGFTYQLDNLANSTAYSGFGLTIPTGNNGNMSGYANPVISTLLADGSNQYSLRISGVPEPTTLSLACVGFVGLLRRRR